jgi:2,3,4,5-tetrahydropyridine-2-carboxylate N-succinyltransferase
LGKQSFATREETTTTAIREVIELLDAGKLRVAEPKGDGWQMKWNKKSGCNVLPYSKWKLGRYF